MDMRYTLRSFSRQPGIAAIAIGLLALVIALNASIFSLVDAVFLKPLPGSNPADLATTNGEQRDFSELIFDQFRLRIGNLSTLPLAISDATARVEMAGAKLRTQTRPVRVLLISSDYSRVRRAKAITSRERRVEDGQADEVEIAGLKDECPLSRDKAVISKRINLEQNLLIIISLTPGEIFGEAVESPDEVQMPSAPAADCSVDGTTGPCALAHEHRSTSHSAVRVQTCPSIGRRVAAEDEEQGPDSGQTPALPPERTQERRR